MRCSACGQPIQPFEQREKQAHGAVSSPAEQVPQAHEHGNEASVIVDEIVRAGHVESGLPHQSINSPSVAVHPTTNGVHPRRHTHQLQP